MGGGVLIRKSQVELLQRSGFQVTVVTPNYQQKELLAEQNVIRVPLVYNFRASYFLERVGIYEDYLDKWVSAAYKYLLNKVQKSDIVFATSGGELACFKLGSLLKEKLGCKFVVNFQDPLDYGTVNGVKIDNRFHVSRDQQEKKYLRNVDLIITSSQVNEDSLKNKYPYLAGRIVNSYFGYIKKVDLIQKQTASKLRIAYGGVFGTLQSPEILAKALEGMDGVEAHFIGNYTYHKPIHRFLNKFNFMQFLPRDEFLKFMMQNIDVGFVSLTSDYLGACVPSKLYEYINLALPILGALPAGDAVDIINQNGYGVACKYNDLDSLRHAIQQLRDKETLCKFQENILEDRDSWSMEERIKEVAQWLRDL